MALDSIRGSPVMDMPVLNKFKRKRSCSVEPLSSPHLPQVKKACLEGPRVPSVDARGPAQSECEPLRATAKHGSSPVEAPADECANSQMQPNTSPSVASCSSDARRGAVTNNPVPVADHITTSDTPVQSTEDALGLTPLQQAIENEFNMQILLKHNELRLIEQELAKCQIALEQLRRCELRPFPGFDGPSPAVSAGTGLPVAPQPGHTQPPYPAPYGVTDGPYSRHYRQWLLHDPLFESTPVQTASYVDAFGDVPARSTRNAATARKTAQKTTAMGGKMSDGFSSLPNYPAPPAKNKLEPLVLRRSTDGQLVKLICNNCLRGNFSSIQGFLNHCRIAHKVDYKSHDLAAIDCGRLLDEHEAASLSAEAHASSGPKAAASRSSSATTTPFKSQHLVHPLNAAGSVVSQPAPPRSKAAGPKPNIPVPSLVNLPPQKNATPFVPSAKAPRLSAQFAKYQLGGNLEQAILSASQKIDLDAGDEATSPDSETTSPVTPAPSSRTFHGPVCGGSLAPPGVIARPPSRKGRREPARYRPSPLAPMPTHLATAGDGAQNDIPGSPQDHSSTLSPHTADSNPGLVSDHDDDDQDGSASEDEVPQATLAHSLDVRRRDCADNMDIDITEEDDIDEHRVLIRRSSMTAASEESRVRTSGSPSRK
ncbi:hypothetical protein M433DRAFT_5667 [Acidomyces richmondensis BFW]|nr:hypothetical protein M433DRAFT_5667 [Acidomyces richmondensis BFW]